MESYVRIAILLSLGAAVSSWNLLLENICQAGEPSGTNHTTIHAKSFLKCASACDFNPNCYYLSFYGTECVMYDNASPCGMGVGPTRDVYKVEPPCEPGWHRYGGSCYLVDQNGNNAPVSFWTCNPDAHPVTISNAAEGAFLTELIRSMNVSDTNVWLGGHCSNGPFEWWNPSEPWVYQNWDDGEPDNSPIKACVAMNLSNGKWKTDDCALVKINVCEKPFLK